MYRHLLVPIDGSPLSNTTVEQAVAMARAIGARVTFLHARSDFGASSDGALLHAVAPTAFAAGAAGNSKALLAKAEAAARAAGVNCSSADVVNDRPHDAIHDAAQAHACDLIFMASHGRRGIKGALLGSVTQKVLQRAALPVLVAAVESNLPSSDAQRALATIRDEHRSLAAVINGLQHLLSQAKVAGVLPNFALLRAMLYYIENLPEKLHHPKEEAFLFRLLRERTAEFDAVIVSLEKEHANGAELFSKLRDALGALESGTAKSADEFTTAVEHFAEAQWRHIGAEEKLILPAATRHMTAQDWHEIAAAFLDNADPRFGVHADEPFVHLFTRLLTLASPAINRSPGESK